MKFLSSRELSTRPAKVYEELARTGKLVINYNGKPKALMVSVDEDNFEGIWLAISRALAEYALNEIRESAKEKKLCGLKPDEIDNVIRKSRRERKK